MRCYPCLLVMLFVASFTIKAESPETHASEATPRIAIIIDDLGNHRKAGERAAVLPGAVTLNILPFTPHARHFASLAKKHNKELMLHIPMEAISARTLGNGGLHSAMQEQQFYQTLYANLNFVQDISGVSNHMGSRLTQDDRMMEWFMTGLATHGKLFFVDSRTTSKSIAIDHARKNQINHTKRDVFLDHIKSQESIQRQWNHMLRLAKQRGSALVIGHPYAVTLSFLEQHLPELESQGVRLVSVSELIEWRKTRRNYVWQTSLSPSPRAVKN